MTYLRTHTRRQKWLEAQSKISSAFNEPATCYHASVYGNSEPADSGYQLSATDDLDTTPLFIHLPLSEKFIPAHKRIEARKFAEVLVMVVQNSPEVAPFDEGQLLQVRNDCVHDSYAHLLTVQDDSERVYFQWYADSDPFAEECLGIYCKKELFPHIASLLPRFLAVATH